MLARALRAVDATRGDTDGDGSEGDGSATGTERERLRARILITRAVSRFGIDGPEAALAELEAVHALAARHRMPMLAVQAHLQTGAIRVMASDWTGSLAAFAHVEPHLAELVPRERCAAVLNAGLAETSLGHLDPGRAHLEEALRLAREHALVGHEYKARHNLGCLAYLAGDIPQALRLMAEAAEMPVDITDARGLLDRGKVLLDAGLVDDAEGMLERALHAARQDRQPVEGADVQLDLARAAVLRGDTRLARRRAAHAARAFRRLHAPERAEEVELVVAVIDVGDGRRLEDAATVAERWRGADPQLPQSRLGARIRCEIALRRGDLATAQEALSTLDGPLPQPLGPYLHGQLLAGRVAVARGDTAGARQSFRDAAERLSSEQAGVHSLEIRAALAFHADRIRAADVAAATATGSPALLFESAERWRATSHRAPPLRPPSDPQTAALVTRLRRRSRDPGAGPDGESETVRLQRLITERLRSAGGEDAPGQLAPVSLDRAVALAEETGSTLLCLHEHDGRLVRLRVDRRGVEARPLGPTAEITSLAGRAMADARAAALAHASMAPLLTRARAVSSAAVDAAVLADLRADGTVVVVPTGPLASLAWPAMPALADHPVVVAPSVTAWAGRVERLTAGDRATVDGVWAGSGHGLATAGAEVAEVARCWAAALAGTVPDGGVQARPGATSAEVREALGEAAVVHLAAHGRHVEQSPLFSSLDLADGPVYAHELGAPPPAQLVVLSACDVGRSRGRVGDEPLGLAAALLSLGVGCVVAATVPVADEVAAAASGELHRRVAAGADVATALRETTRTVPGADAFCAYGSSWRRPLGATPAA